MALTLGDNFSYQGAKPLDARLKYDTLAAMKAVADSTMYDGCMAYCVATDKTYQWKSTNTVDPDTGKWSEYSSGGGHDIKNNGVAVTERGVMNFTDFDITDDSTNEETDVKAHRLTSAEFSDICTPLPGAVSDMPVLFDETGTEYVVGWYKLANGTKKPLYRKMISLSNLPKGQTTVLHGISNLGAVEKIYGTMKRSDNNYYICVPFLYGIFSSCIYIFDVSQTSFQIVIGDDFNNLFNYANCGTVTIEYTKTTDTPV